MLLDILVTLHFILLFLISVRVLARHDLTAPARLAWIVVLFILPYIDVVGYWLFGDIHLGRKFIDNHKKLSINHIIIVLRYSMIMNICSAWLSMTIKRPLLIQQQRWVSMRR